MGPPGSLGQTIKPAAEPRTSFDRIVLALFAAAAMAAAFAALDYVFGLFALPGSEHVRQYGLSKGTFAFLVGLVIWLSGFLVSPFLAGPFGQFFIGLAADKGDMPYLQDSSSHSWLSLLSEQVFHGLHRG